MEQPNTTSASAAATGTRTATTTRTQANTSSQKRKYSEYHDPDYPSRGQPTETAASTATTTDAKNAEKCVKLERSEQSVPNDGMARRMAAICSIVRREFQKEITMKEQQLAEIDARLLQARQLLDKLRYDVVSEYYRKQEVPLTSADMPKVRGNDTLFDNEYAGPQMPLHPAIKKIVGKRPTPLQQHLPERTAAALAKQTIRLRNPAHRRAERRRQKQLREQGIVIDHTKEPQTETPPTPTPARTNIKSEPYDEQPCTSKQALERQLQLDVTELPALNAARLNNKDKFIITVGNTSKYIGGDLGEDANAWSEQTLNYKWLVYVQGTKLPQPLETYIKKVRFQLHHSYRPNDIVDVHKPPFQLSRRGWGEFPMRIQLYFQEQWQQKPVQLMHTVVLDKTMCGLHTMGAETMVEVWLRADPTSAACAAKSEPPTPATDSCKQRTISITHNKEELDDNLFGCISKTEMSGDIEKIEPTVLVSEPLTCKLKPSSPKREMPMASATVAANAKASSNGNVLKGIPDASSVATLRSKHAQSNGHGPRNVVFQKAGKLYIIDPLQTRLRQAQKQQSLLKPQLSLLKSSALSKHWQMLESIQNDHGYANMSGHSNGDHLTLRVPKPPPSPRLRLEQLFKGLSFVSMRSAVEFLLRRLPLIASPNCSVALPFVSPTPAAFQATPALAQHCFEYMRARAVQRFMRQHAKLQQLEARHSEPYWSNREIVGFARLHGYTPALKAFGAREAAAKLQAETQLAQRVQQQLQEQPQTHVMAHATLSSNGSLNDWLSKQSALLQGHERQVDEQQPIDIVSLDTEQKEQRPAPSSNLNHRQLLYLPAPQHLEAAAQLVRDMCKDIGITLHTEQALPGVSQPLSLTLLAHVLQIFVEKLLRRTLAAKLQQQSAQASNALPPSAANVELTLLPYDFGRVIAQWAEMDFLGNSNLGVPRVDSQLS